MNESRALKNKLMHLNKLQTAVILNEHRQMTAKSYESAGSNQDSKKRSTLTNTDAESPAPIQSVNKLNMGLYNRLQTNAQSIGKRFIHKSSGGISQNA